MTKPNVKIVSLNDWVIMYLDDKKVTEGHELNPHDICEALAGVAPEYWNLEDDNYLPDEYDGQTPDEFSPQHLEKFVAC